MNRLLPCALLVFLSASASPRTPPEDPRTFTVEELEAAAAEPNPFLSLLPLEARPDWEYWRARMAYEARQRRARLAAPPPPVIVVEDEPAGVLGLNDLPLFAQAIPGFGSRAGENPRASVSGHLLALPTPLATLGEPDGSIPEARPVPLAPGDSAILAAEIGDGVHGSGGGQPTGDFDFYSLTAAAGQTIEVAVRTPVPLGDLDPITGLYDSTGTLLAINDDVPITGFVATFDSYLSFTTTSAGTYFVVVAGFYPFADDEADMLPGDPFDSASGPGIGSEGTYDLVLGLDRPAPPDLDFYRFELRAGDVVGTTVLGGARRVSLFDPAGARKVASFGRDLSGLYSDASPLPGGGAATIAYVIETPGTYAVAVDVAAGPEAVDDGSYELEIAVARPSLDREEDDVAQILFLDFDGATLDADIFFPGLGEVTLSPLADFLPGWGLPATAEDAVIDAVVAAVDENLSRDVRATGANGDFDADGVPGHFDVEIRNSRDHADPWGQPNVSRVIVGGTTGQLGLLLIGIAEVIDPGHFARQKSALVLLDLLSAPADDPNSLNSFQIHGATFVDFVGLGVGNVAAHEAGHLFGNFHTRRDVPEGEVGFANVMDRIDLLGLLVGEDGVFGTPDDADLDLGPDVYTPREGFSGVEDTLNVLSFGLGAGGRRPAVAVDRLAHDFGALDPGSSAVQAFVFSNEGFLDLEVSATSLVGPDAADFSITGGAPFTLAPAATRSVEVSFSPSSLGPKQATLAVSSNDPDDDPLVIALSGFGGVPDIAIDATAHDYGDLVYGDADLSASHTFVVENTAAAADLHVTNADFTGADPGQFTVDVNALPWILAPGETRALEVSFAPGGLVGAMSARLRLSSNDPDESPLDVLLAGRALGPDIAVRPSSPFSFGALALGVTASRLFIVENFGQRDLEIAGAALTGDDTTAFAITDGAGAVTLPPLAIHVVRVTFTPDSPGEALATLEIASSDPDENPFRLELLGFGLAPAIAIEPEAFDYGEVRVGESAVGSFLIENVGDLTLSGSAALAGGDLEDFTFASGEGFFTLAPEEAFSVHVLFEPSAAGIRQATLRLTSDDPEREVLDVPLAGTGLANLVLEVPSLSRAGFVLMAFGLASLALLLLRRRC